MFWCQGSTTDYPLDMVVKVKHATPKLFVSIAQLPGVSDDRETRRMRSFHNSH